MSEFVLRILEGCVPYCIGNFISFLALLKYVHKIDEGQIKYNNEPICWEKFEVLRNLNLLRYKVCNSK